MKLGENARVILGNGYSSNAYFFGSPEGTLCIDAGTDEAAFRENASDSPKILLTHGHADHWLAAAREKLFLHEADINCFGELNSMFGGLPTPQLEKLPRSFEWGDFSFKVIETPGHTPGSVCFFEEKNKWLFSGDTLFAEGGVGRTDLPCGNREALEASLKLLESLDYSLLLPGHGAAEE
ncbi:MBL fold metallo-hydrolase [Candidatus Micrarchaeota archaeon CG_4_10_14_0_2_um_filter_60_11]|nr:MAG: hypothetical protein AUJ16_04490 [Candidatus Micrarchaeota archaeon CG1_02_60_51]PIN96395.1 MAG: MBL fold metallo-hydrolase [Candidatus Micrarchaeota archaeon CG10_big_fil_rev_8_21_14_0_10_60_32]PIO02143.1 MAG: MBL fold metallo-hydrolase [Candidatus Micrarchaeota archaeon CG09_land_8_20_14_0_10_60_16]PIY91741.1 MAG: MBL fold metallo-hydrolase [Candidatus Micrarchaeota archaeon CG_4_10_14_0_8_um_filter_60_7]PIZ91007.1 MAG: MBL fold metallo-hydrolase [Candidatus Micrarchaeota archaeon CG_